MTKKIRIIIWAVLVATFLCGVAYTATSMQAGNRLETGFVEIELKEFHLKDGTESAWSGEAKVMPGEKVSLIPRVYNKGTSCYIRAQITFKGTDKVGEEHLRGMNKNWYKADDGYYYYKKALKNGDTVDIFQALQIPKNLPKSMANKSFMMDVSVHAIQSKNFEPEYDMSQPWGSVEIVEHDKEGDYDYDIFEESEGNSFEIVYDGESGKIIGNTKDFFAHVPYLVPGDVYTETLEFNNTTNHDIKLFFRSIYNGHEEFPDKIRLKITMVVDGKQTIIYDGTLRGEHFTKNSLLGMIPSGVKGKFIFEISVPKEMNNTYSLLDNHMQWVFSTEPIEDITGIDTGDHSNIVVYLLMAVVAAAGLTFVIMKRRKEDETDE